jgi:transposase-like protein
VYFIEPSNGVSRSTRTGAQSERRVWRCRDCKKQFSVITNTMMHGTKIALRIWLMVILELCSSKNGVAAREVERKYGVAGRSAWFMLHRIRKAMSHDDFTMFEGDVVADETWIGGNPKNMHAHKRPSFHARTKTPVVTLINSQTGEARSKVVTGVTGGTMRRIMLENVNMGVSTLHTDSAKVYGDIGWWFAGHHVVNHSIGEYVTEKSHGTNMAENFFSQLKRSIDGTHHSVSKEHMQRYLNEFDYRYSTCDLTDTERMADLATRVAGRLTYKAVTR